MAYWLDYSAARLTGPTVKNAGYTGAVRYIDDINNPNLRQTKHTTPAEYQSLVSAGLGVRLVFEVTTGDPDGGYARGVAYAQRAKAGADALGYSGVIYFCEDRPTTPSVANWRAYLQGAISVLGRSRVGAYGFFGAMDAANGYVDHFWQAGARRDLRPFVQLWQDNNTQVSVGGVTCDRNLVIADLSAPAGGGGSAPSSVATSARNEERTVLAPASADNYIVIPTFGGTKLYVGAAYGRTVNVTERWDIGPSGSAGGAYLNNGAGQSFAADRPGPLPVNPAAVSVTLRYNADHEFTAWVA